MVSLRKKVEAPVATSSQAESDKHMQLELWPMNLSAFYDRFQMTNAPI